MDENRAARAASGGRKARCNVFKRHRGKFKAVNKTCHFIAEPGLGRGLPPFSSEQRTIGEKNKAPTGLPAGAPIPERGTNVLSVSFPPAAASRP